jgi:TonB family protein
MKMDEVVVTGVSAGTTRKQLGSYISTVKSDQLTKGATGNVLSALQGKTAGAQSIQNSGDPGGGMSVRLRGISSVNSSFRVFNCDDSCKASINGSSSVIVQTGFGEDSGWVDVTDKVNARARGALKFEAINDREGYTYGFLVRKNGQIVMDSSCGTSRIIGCENDRHDPERTTRLFFYNFELKPGATASTSTEKVKALPGAVVSGGVLNGKATYKPTPLYSGQAKAAKASGTVVVQVVVNEEGNVESAQAVSGHPLLWETAVEAAKKAKFPPTFLQGQPAKVNGVLTYNFVL